MESNTEIVLEVETPTSTGDTQPIEQLEVEEPVAAIEGDARPLPFSFAKRHGVLILRRYGELGLRRWRALHLLSMLGLRDLLRLMHHGE